MTSVTRVKEIAEEKLRDKFAGIAMGGLIQKGNVNLSDLDEPLIRLIARWAYVLADEMLDEKERSR